MTSRREILGFGLIGLTRKSNRPVAGGFVNESHTLGHRLRDRTVAPRARHRRNVPIVIVGGGIAGLSAAWRLHKKGLRDFVLLEMEPSAGGNSRWGENHISRYPWAAHYLPVPGAKSVLVRELMEELGVLRDGVWEERYLCFSPQERLFLHGRWQEGLEPEVARTRQDTQDFKRFDDLIAEQRASGQFTIPAEVGAKPSPFDAMSMEQWLASHGLQSPYLRWYVDYACRDDFGANLSATSAWAGIHYFASRDHDEKGPLTWAEGNGWIVQRLMAGLSQYVRTNSPVIRIAREHKTAILVSTPETEYVAQHVIFAAPTFLARYIIEGFNLRLPFVYSPWVTANLTLSRSPKEKGSETAWDNVTYGSPSLGYVVANHMSLRTHHEGAVWTWYHALGAPDTSASRRMLLDKDYSYWKEFILADLERAHPDIRECVDRIDVMRMGHAMARPVPGSLFSQERRALDKGLPGITLANSDLSGFSIFEEAQYRGVRAADRAARSI